jgi:hypothetical protein
MAAREGAGFGELDMMGKIAVNIQPPRRSSTCG